MLVTAIPPVLVLTPGAYAALAVDGTRRRVYAAHPGGHSLVILDADGVLRPVEVRLDAASGVAVEPIGGHVFVGTTGGTVCEVDPVGKSVLRTLAVGGPVATLAYDAVLGRIYAAEAGGTHVWVIDARTFALIATVVLPGREPGYQAVDPITHDVYQTLAEPPSVATIDAHSDTVRTTLPTPELTGNSALQFDPAFGQIVTAGTTGALAVYDRGGARSGRATVPAGIGQCSLDAAQHTVICAAAGGLTRLQLKPAGEPAVLDSIDIAPGVHGAAVDPKTHLIWTAWPNPAHRGSFAGAFGSPSAVPSPTASPR